MASKRANYHLLDQFTLIQAVVLVMSRTSSIFDENLCFIIRFKRDFTVNFERFHEHFHVLLQYFQRFYVDTDDLSFDLLCCEQIQCFLLSFIIEKFFHESSDGGRYRKFCHL